jgi:hypothetical protein
MIQYDCEGCGITVYSSYPIKSSSGLCPTCELIDHYFRYDLHEFWAAYRQLNPEEKTA